MGRKWFDDTLGRIAALASGSDARGSLACDDCVPEPESLVGLFGDIGAIWADESARIARPAPAEEALESIEALTAFADRQNLELRFENRSVSSLTSVDFPAVMLTPAGAGRTLIGRRGRVFTARGSAGNYEASLESLTAEEAGTLVLVRSRQSGSEGRSAPNQHGLPASPSPTSHVDDPVHGVMHYMLTHQRPLLIQLMVAAIFSNMMLLAVPVYTGLVFDRVIPHSAFDTLWAVSIGVMIALSADLAVRWVRLKLQDALASAASAALQASIVRRLVEVKMIEAPRSAGALTLRLREIDGLTQLVPQFLTGAAIDAPFLLLVFALIWMNGGPVVLAPIVGLGVLAAIHHFANLGAKVEQSRSMRLAQAQTNQLIETVEGLETVKTTRTERRVLGRFEKTFDDFAYSSHVTRLWHSIAGYANVTVGQAMIVMVMVIGVYQVAEGTMTVGGLSACCLLVGRVISPIGQLVMVVHRMHQSRATLRTLSEGAVGRGEKAGDKSGAVQAPRACAIRLAAVSFSYPGQTARQLENVSLTIKPGERVAIIGRSGSGKSSLLKLLTRLIEPDRGSVLVDELDSRQYQPSDLRQVVGYMGQTPGLVDDTLLANLSLGLDAVDPARLDAIARLTGVAEFAGRHPNGFALKVGPRGERLSGGERQSVALARLMLADPKVLILDEPTSSMDTMLETRLVRDLKSHIGGRTLIVATHRAPILELADRLIWLEAGKVVADGPKAEVLKRLSGVAS